MAIDSKDYLSQAKIDYKLYQTGLNYQRQMKFTDKWPEYERFLANDQWPAVTKNTKNLPRPVFNILALIQGHKVSSVMNEQVKMVFSVEDADETTEDYKVIGENFSKTADATWEQIKQNEINEEVLESASNIGTGIVHYYWEDSIEGGNKTKYKGRLCGEVIDPINIFFGNPQQKNVQKQPYIVIQSRDLVSSVVDIAKNNKLPVEIVNQIKPDKDTNNDYDSAKIELDDTEKVTILTKYYKKSGKTYFRKSASGVLFQPEIEAELNRYPIAVMQWKKRKKSVFGMGDTEGLIPNQKAINFLMAMQLLSVQNTGWPKLLIKRQYIKQEITNKPGEIVYDDSPSGWSAQYLNTGQISSHAQLLVDKVLEITKEVSGANENALGERSSGDLNASAIMLLQKQAGVPIEGIKRRFYQFIEDIGLIWEDFFKNKYITERLIPAKDIDGKETPIPFRGTDHANVFMNLKISIGPSSSYSETLMMSSLDRFLEKQYITFDDYLEFAPPNVVPFKDRLKKRLEQRQGNPELTLLSQLLPEEREVFFNLPSEKQQEFIKNAMQPQPSLNVPAQQPML